MTAIFKSKAFTTKASTGARLVLIAACLLPFASCGDRSTEDSASGLITEGQSGTLTPEEQQMREKKAKALLDRAHEFSPVERIEKLADVAHVYFDTRVGPQAWQELIFYLLDHSNDDFRRAEKELILFARRCPDKSELLTAALLVYWAPLKKIKENPRVADREEREAVSRRALKIWRQVGVHLCGLEKFRNDFGVHLETGNALALDGAYAEAERIWAKVEMFEEPARDEDRMKVLLKRADLLRTQGGDRKLALALYEKVLSYQEKMAELIPDSFRTYVKKAVDELKASH